MKSFVLFFALTLGLMASAQASIPACTAENEGQTLLLEDGNGPAQVYVCQNGDWVPASAVRQISAYAAFADLNEVCLDRATQVYGLPRNLAYNACFVEVKMPTASCVNRLSAPPYNLSVGAASALCSKN